MIDDMEKYFKKMKEKHALIFILCLAFILLAAPLLVRLFFYDNTMAGTESYYHLRMASLMQKQGTLTLDPLLSGTRFYTPNPYHYVLVFLGNIIPIEILSIILPVVFGLITVLLLFFIIKKFVRKLHTRFLIVFFIVLSPVFIYVFSHQQSLTLLVFLIVLGFFFFSKKGKWPILGLVFLAFIPFFGLLHTLLVLVLLAAYISTHKQKLPYFFVYIMLIVIMSSIIMTKYPFFFFQKALFSPSNIVGETLSDLGAWYGFSLFLLILAAIGIIKTWQKKYKHVFLYLFLVISFAFVAFFDPSYHIYTGVLLCVYAGIGYTALWKMKWELKRLRKLSLFLIILGLLFSATSATSRLSQYGPDQDLIESLEWMKENLPEDSVIVTYPDYAYWVHYYSDKRTLLDPEFSRTARGGAIQREIANLFQLRRESDAMQIINKYRIQYFLITPEMKTSLVWHREDQGLLFLLNNSEKFKKLYQDQGIEVWQVQQ